ncbi:MAG: hypothetical protein KatS3mg024_0861 [Armatimonadota bacterium]|nr:MAG: hypothetical protein KatS3mg024_0861 [Armatimonadota bacterium]
MARRLLFAVALLTAAGACLAAREDLLKIAPDRINSWRAVPDATVYARGDGIVDIYNGGYELYTRAGVTEALRRMYAQGERFVEVTAHTMTSSRAARAFLMDRYRVEINTASPRGELKRFAASGSGTTTAYAIEGRYFLTVVVYEDSAAARNQALGFVKVLEQNASRVR